MIDFEIGDWSHSYWLLMVITCGLVMVVSLIWKRNARSRFAGPGARSRLFAKPLRQDGLRAVAIVAVMLLLVGALLDVRWGESQDQVPQEGTEIVFLLDVSRSMLAEDVSPNRLERAKQMIKDIVAEMAGDRVGLVIFAGESRQFIPLTNHYGSFNQLLDEVSPQSLDRGGSRLGDAITVAGNAFLDQSGSQRTVVLLTDGEDQESRPLEAARRANGQAGIRIFAIGLGDLKTGARVPASTQPAQSGSVGGYLMHEGEQVWSKLDGRVLAEIAQLTGGAYIPAGTKQVEMASVYHQYISAIEKTTFEMASINRLRPRFQWFLLPATLILAITITTQQGWRRNRGRSA